MAKLIIGEESALSYLSHHQWKINEYIKNIIIVNVETQDEIRFRNVLQGGRTE